MSKIIAIYGKTCSSKSDVARALSHLTGYKLASRGEAVTTEALLAKRQSGSDVDVGFHEELDEQTRSMLSWPDEVLILESRFMDAVLCGCDGVFFVHLTSDDAVREERWRHRREEGGGRTRQIGEGVAQRDAADEKLGAALYSGFAGVEPDMSIDTTEGSAHDHAVQILIKFTGDDLSHLISSGKEAMDKRETKGIKPGATAGEVVVYNALRNPFGGYILDDESGRQVFVHKSAVESIGLTELRQGQRVSFEIAEDGFGGFRATNVKVG